MDTHPSADDSAVHDTLRTIFGFESFRPNPKTPRVLELLPKKPGAVMKKLNIQTDDAGRIMGMTIFDKSGNRTEIVFSDVKEGTGVEDTVFEFKAPKGTEVIEQ